jgi:hypothetical protein
LVTIEFGDTTNSSSPKAEGGIFVEKLGGYLGAYVGHLDTQQKRIRDLETYYIEQNPVDIFYARKNFGVAINYSRDVQNNVAFDQGQKTLGSRIGYHNEWLDMYLVSTWIGKSQKAHADKLATKLPGLQGGMEFSLDKYFFFVEGAWSKSVQNITTPVSRLGSDVEIVTGEGGVLDRSFGQEGRELYYGISLKYDRVKKHIYSTTTMTLPFVVGLQQQLSDWLRVRASLSQNFLVGYTRDQTQNPPANRRDSVRNNTTAAAGASFMYQNFELAGVLSAATSGDLNASSFLANASLSYSF